MLPDGMGTPMAVILAVLVLLAAVAVATGLGGDGGEASTAPRAAPVAAIVGRVERLRGLRFRRRPVVRTVSPAQARREGLADLDRSYPEARRRADEEVLKLLGLIEPDVDLRAVSSSVFGEQVAGYYDPRTRRLRVVAGARTSSRVLHEIVLAHELTHALEDQRLGLDQERLATGDDRALAYLALVEGSATKLMLDYATRHFGAEELLGGLLGSVFEGTGDLPPFLAAQLLLPYEQGARFVGELVSAAGDRWTLVDAAHRGPPLSTEQVLHPEAYLRFEDPDRVGLRAGSILGGGWRRAARGVFGEWQTRELLALAGGSAGVAAAGWGGDAYELWRRDEGGRCGAPCPRDDALVMRWTWDTRADEREFATRLRSYVRSGLGARPAGPGRWSARGGGVAIARDGGAVTLALAPDVALAARLAREAG
jgi:hypothetical protein